MLPQSPCSYDYEIRLLEDPIKFLTKWGIRNDETEYRPPSKRTGLLTVEANIAYIKVIDVYFHDGRHLVLTPTALPSYIHSSH